MSASNVVRLPTAAPRRVNNYRYKEQRRAAVAARSGTPFVDRLKLLASVRNDKRRLLARIV